MWTNLIYKYHLSDYKSNTFEIKIEIPALSFAFQILQNITFYKTIAIYYINGTSSMLNWDVGKEKSQEKSYVYETCIAQILLTKPVFQNSHTIAQFF